MSLPTMERYNSLKVKERQEEEEFEKLLINVNQVEKLNKKSSAESDPKKLVRSTTLKDDHKRINIVMKVSLIYNP
jgi:hypothetical protein